MSSVGDEYPKEQARCRELLAAYQKLGPVGAFGAWSIEEALKAADEAMAGGDVVAILVAFKAMEQCK